MSLHLKGGFGTIHAGRLTVSNNGDSSVVDVAIKSISNTDDTEFKTIPRDVVVEQNFNEFMHEVVIMRYDKL